MANYKVKSWPSYFRAIVDGTKKHDMRNMEERNYQIGDVLTLQEYDPFKGEYTGAEQDVEITYITSRQTPCAFSSAMLDRSACILSLMLVGGMRTAKLEDSCEHEWQDARWHHGMLQECTKCGDTQ